jgi:hypothetical protein
MNKKENRGGARKGSGRKPGKKAFVKAKPNPTKVMRIPVELVEAVQDLIDRYNYEKQDC